MKRAPTDAQVARARAVAADLEIGAVYVLPTGRFGRFAGRREDELNYTTVDTAQCREQLGEPVMLAADLAARCRVAWHAQQWQQRVRTVRAEAAERARLQELRDADRMVPQAPFLRRCA